MIRWLIPVALAFVPVAGSTQVPPPSIEKRMQRVEDEIAIQRLLIDYAAFLDSRNYAAYAALFTADGEWSNAGGSRKGQPAIRAMLEGTLGAAGGANRANYHIISNPRIQIEGDRATATSRYLFVMRAADGRPTPSLAGVYTDDLVRQGREWKIRRRVADDIMPTPEEWRKTMAAQRGAK
jgi:ketosteroid isomerase-like protein